METPTDEELQLLHPDRSPEEARSLHQLKSEFNASVEDAMKFVDLDPSGLNRWMPKEWDKRPRQTGMEAKHQQWVLATLNFLTAMDIPFYNRDEDGNKLPGEKQIPERLSLVVHQYSALAKTAAGAADRVKRAQAKQSVAEEESKEIKRIFRLALEEIESRQRDSRETMVAVHELLSHVFSDEWMKAVRDGFNPVESQKDEHGVRRVTIDARDIVLRLGLHRIVHDLQEDEKVCGACLGLGIIRHSAPYRVGSQRPDDWAWPYHDNWMGPCPNCYMGKVKICLLCTKPLARGHLQCQCEGAYAARRAEDAKKEEERRQGLLRVPLAQYDGKMLWADKADRYVDVDDVENWLEDHEDEVFFACKPMDPLMVPDAADIIEDLQNNSTENASPEDGDDVLDFSKEAETELAELLQAWAKKNVTARTMWYADMDVIVEVPRPPADPPDQPDS